MGQRRHYRYRTRVLVGPWRDARGAAVADALKSRQAVSDPDHPDGLRWVVNGEIEEEPRGTDPA